MTWWLRLKCYLFHRQWHDHLQREYTPGGYHWRESWFCLACCREWEEYDDLLSGGAP